MPIQFLKGTHGVSVLIVDDDAALGSLLQKGLIGQGHKTEWVGDGELAVNRLAARNYDMVILDLSLPRKDGVDVLIDLRSRCQDTAVLVVTGRSNLDEKVKCFDLGADDYLMKPFTFKQMQSRCKALLRRIGQMPDPSLRHGPITIEG